MRVEVWWKHAANAKILQETIKVPFFSHIRHVVFFISVALFSHLFSADIVSVVFFFHSLSEGFNSSPEAQLIR